MCERDARPPPSRAGSPPGAEPGAARQPVHGVRHRLLPPGGGVLPQPGCTGETFDEVELSRTGHVWSYTDARYQPPPPYIPATDPYEPFALAAVELEAEGLVVLGQVADGYGVDDLTVGAPVELVVETALHRRRRRRPHDLALEAREAPA